ERWEQAMQHLLAAEDFDRAAATVAERGGSWITAGALGSLAAFADALPKSALEAHPRALAHRAEVARLRDEYDLAQSLFNRAAVLLHEPHLAQPRHARGRARRLRRGAQVAQAYAPRRGGGRSARAAGVNRAPQHRALPLAPGRLRVVRTPPRPRARNLPALHHGGPA